MNESWAVLPKDEHNQKLVSNAHPSDWVNPKPADRYHLVVIGGGTAGLVSAAGAAGLGAKVALVERHLLGGDCLNVGCVPSKALIRASRAAADVHDAADFGISVPSSWAVDFPKIMERLRRLRAGLSPNDSADRFKSLGVDVFLGEGKFIGSNALEVGGARLNFSKAVIATGARAAKLPIPGLWEAGALTNETVFSLTALPKRLIVIGAGPIGCELSQAFARFGSKVILLESSAQILGREDAEAARVVETSLKKDGVKIIVSCEILGAEKRGEERIMRLERGGKIAELAADAIMVGMGRAPNVEGLGLEAAGVEYDKRGGVKVDERLRTTNSRVFAAGDVCSPYKFTHAADAMARIAIQNALFAGRKKMSALVIPWCTYTDPEIAHVGLYERDAKAKGIPVQTLVQELKDVDRAVLDGQAEGFVKIHLKAGTDEILGATIVAAHAGEMIGELSLAMTAKIGFKAIGSTIHPYPTQAEAIKKTADAYNRSRLTPTVKRLLALWLGRP
ncbi:MAG TPA: mercuric reductase [Elusimicrobiota bacterium]|nr:mercuric reductase [Elusimicrobiota bacterium]